MFSRLALAWRFDTLVFWLPWLFWTLFAAAPLFLAQGRTLAKAVRRTSYDKGARQFAWVCCVLASLGLLAGKGLLFWHYQAMFPPHLAALCLDCVWLLGLLVVIPLWIHCLGWRFLGNHPLLQFLCTSTGFLAGLCGSFLFWCLFPLLSRMPQTPLTPDWPVVRDAIVSLLPFMKDIVLNQVKPLLLGDTITFLGILASPASLALLMVFPVLFGMPAVFASLSFLMLRPFHDYGRDHYTIVLTWSARYARAMGIVVSLCCMGCLGVFGYRYWMGLDVSDVSSHVSMDGLLFHGLLLLLFGGATGVWSSVCRSSYPLRQKVWLSLASCMALLGTIVLACAWIA
ncbi:MAG: hypothetical protein IJS54_05420 [Desulfovibrio sp.]|nr:hypothetical protein [Desulfovibrio sp.]